MIRADLHASLKCACRAAIIAGNSIHDLKLERWSQSFGDCGVEHIRLMWDHEQSKLSLEPSNAFEQGDD